MREGKKGGERCGEGKKGGERCGEGKKGGEVCEGRMDGEIRERKDIIIKYS